MLLLGALCITVTGVDPSPAKYEREALLHTLAVGLRALASDRE